MLSRHHGGVAPWMARSNADMRIARPTAFPSPSRLTGNRRDNSVSTWLSLAEGSPRKAVRKSIRARLCGPSILMPLAPSWLDPLLSFTPNMREVAATTDSAINSPTRAFDKSLQLSLCCAIKDKLENHASAIEHLGSQMSLLGFGTWTKIKPRTGAAAWHIVSTQMARGWEVFLSNCFPIDTMNMPLGIESGETISSLKIVLLLGLELAKSCAPALHSDDMSPSMQCEHSRLKSGFAQAMNKVNSAPLSRFH
mmetsp:Transcript_9935/g.27504  ORF Transcript_9935/g.27504 Transcript_9935/m.27504 type:complete len:252 (+) Transcript_9935:3731-4486(+)